jgi:hypothetical protein
MVICKRISWVTWQHHNRLGQTRDMASSDVQAALHALMHVVTFQPQSSQQHETASVVAPAAATTTCRQMCSISTLAAAWLPGFAAAATPAGAAGGRSKKTLLQRWCSHWQLQAHLTQPEHCKHAEGRQNRKTQHNTTAIRHCCKCSVLTGNCNHV